MVTAISCNTTINHSPQDKRLSIHFPPSLNHIYRGSTVADWSQLANITRLDLCGQANINPEHFPPRLQCLNLLATGYQTGVVPPSVTHLMIGSSFIEAGSIPDSVTHLHIGCNAGSIYLPGIIPHSVRYLKIDHGNQPISRHIIPSSVTHLVVCSLKTRFLREAIPSSITHLDIPIAELVDLPPSLRQLRTRFVCPRSQDEKLEDWHDSSITFTNISASNPLPHSFPSMVLGNPLETLQQFPGISITLTSDESRFSTTHLKYRQINDRYALVHGSYTSSIVPLSKLKSAKFLHKLINKESSIHRGYQRKYNSDRDYLRLEQLHSRNGHHEFLPQ
eukprot:gene2633-3035_t